MTLKATSLSLHNARKSLRLRRNASHGEIYFGAEQGINICKVNIILVINSKPADIFINKFIDKYIVA